MSRGIYKHKPLSRQAKLKLSLARKGIKFSEEHIKKLSLANKNQKRPWMVGNKNPNWKGGISKYRRTERQLMMITIKYKRWRSDVFQRDNWTCQTCNNRGCQLEVHHIKSWRDFPTLRFDIDNGVTLCKECHKLTDNYGNRKHS